MMKLKFTVLFRSSLKQPNIVYMSYWVNHQHQVRARGISKLHPISSAMTNALKMRLSNCVCVWQGSSVDSKSHPATTTMTIVCVTIFLSTYDRSRCSLVYELLIQMTNKITSLYHLEKSKLTHRSSKLS